MGYGIVLHPVDDVPPRRAGDQGCAPGDEAARQPGDAGQNNGKLMPRAEIDSYLIPNL